MTADQFGREITMAWRTVVYRDNDSHVRVHVFCGANSDARGRAGELTFRVEELPAVEEAWAHLERLPELDMRHVDRSSRI